jgi:hypothetical protein
MYVPNSIDLTLIPEKERISANEDLTNLFRDYNLRGESNLIITKKLDVLVISPQKGTIESISPDIGRENNAIFDAANSEMVRFRHNYKAFLLRYNPLKG